tara:strand:- start:227 stop:358 length:132 start_codon:yes stop_codon:yes gene_type:complete
MSVFGATSPAPQAQDEHTDVAVAAVQAAYAFINEVPVNVPPVP